MAKVLNRKGRDQPSSKWAASSRGNRMKLNGKNLTKHQMMDRIKMNALDAKFGYETFKTIGEPKIGWLLTMHSMEKADDVDGKQITGIELYFMEQSGYNFKVALFEMPYFYIAVDKPDEEFVALLSRKLESVLAKISKVDKVDLDVPNHLEGVHGEYYQLFFKNTSDLMEARYVLMPIVKKNQQRLLAKMAYEEVNEDNVSYDFLESIMDIREYDVPYDVRMAIDLELRVGAWYQIHNEENGNAVVARLPDMMDKAEPKVLAFDIECTKAALKFPDAEFDQIYMISYMIDGQGYLIISRSIVSQDIPDFEYTPKPNYPGPFTVFNEENEQGLLRKFFDHVIAEKPHIFVTYNGDFFDWPFVEKRALVYGMDMLEEIGISSTNNGEYRGRCSVHLDAFCWVRRDSYLPQGSQGLKAVTKYKLGYDPVEVDPEDMVQLSMEKPMEMATYSVSDAVATYYLYDKYVHLFVFSLCTIIPMQSEDVLRKGSGTLCEMLLMVEAFRGNIICPNKELGNDEKFHKNHPIGSETYIGGHVECLESGVFRADFEYDFDLKPPAFDSLIKNIDRDLTFALEVESNINKQEVTNYDEIREAIVHELQLLHDQPKRKEKPSIYHLDVAAMYPNIILTNRLQPCSIVNEAICASCTYNNSKENNCKRTLDWVWRGDYYPVTRPEYEAIKSQLQYENSRKETISKDAHKEALKKRLKLYCSKTYGNMKITEEIKRTETVCMRENPFYVNTVRAFRDRRYEYKGLTKTWKNKAKEALKLDDLLRVTEANNNALVYDSLQLAHKCILNSFYGYVMRRGARWHSMEMAGMVTHLGSSIIQRAHVLVNQIGRPLELDTDGIWCILPKSFPETFVFQLKSGKTCSISYPCVMLNADVHELYTNPQYQNLMDNQGTYEIHSECSIFFEVDGPYQCMVLPASTEEGKLLKKRYAVFNLDGSLAELKGFELKRRGELQLIKSFQSQVFDNFLHGETLEECYEAVGSCANEWLDIIDTKGEDMETGELMQLLSENRSMSKSLSEYGSQKSTSITTAKRLAEFLGQDMVQSKGLACHMIIASRPFGTTVTERAIPTAIFSAESSVMHHYLRRWLKDPGMTDFDVRSILDWDYYRTRFGNSIQKIISIPAAIQLVQNPVPRVPLPEWMRRLFNSRNSKFQQRSALSYFNTVDKVEDPTASLVKDAPAVTIRDIEDIEKVTISDNTEPSQDLTWIQQRKVKWKQLQAEKLKNPRKKFAKKDGMNAFVTSDERLLAGKWTILEIQALSVHGTFQLWIRNESNVLEKLQVRINRTFYINSTMKKEEACFHPVTVRTLPHGKQVSMLYSVTMDEDVYHSNQKDILALLADPSITGVYESEVSCLHRAIHHIGAILHFKDSIYASPSKFSAKKTFELQDFKHTLEKSSRIRGPVANVKHEDIKRVILFSSRRSNMAVYGLFFLETMEDPSTFVADCHVWLVDPYGSNPSNIQQVFSSVKKTDNCSISVKTSVSVKTDHEARLGANAALRRYLDSTLQTKATIVLAKSPWHKTRLREKLSSLHSYPVCTFSYHEHEEMSYFPSLMWQATSLKRMLVQVTQMNEDWISMKQCAAYSHVPVGNLTFDHEVMILDTMYARILTQKKHLLWKRGVRTEIPTYQNFRLSKSGSYGKVCAEIQLNGLAINTILMAHQLHLIEQTGSDLFQSDTEPLPSHSCGEAFTHLKALVTNLFKDFVDSRSDTTDHLLQHIYRWLSTTSSELHDPLLKDLLSTCMQKLVLQLLADIRRLGASVIYADYSKIIICTNKDSLQTAENYIEFITGTIRQNEMYQVLTLTAVQYWNFFVYLDIENYGGVLLEHGAENNTIISHWNIANYLPPGLDDYFITLVGQWIKRKMDVSKRVCFPIFNICASLPFD